ncbi:unnamed protein product [Arctia plantaginis]|uniref:Uncharacterized protein n=1 Tax=Arctia plantaginis TaxID=874455 RepID=A0A8S1B7H9_ARCPL|nr:unnamed protein product [Arctia plantaginis]
MSHVISSQPSSTSPYQPTEIQESLNGHNQRKSTIETRQDRDDCCFRADKSQGCFIYYCCNFLSSVCGGIRDCTEKCCNCCADCLADCCEDKPEDRNKRRRYGSGQDYDYDDNTWVVGAIDHHNTVPDNQPDLQPIKHDSSVHYSKSHDSGHDNNLHYHDSRTTGHHTHHSGGRDSGFHLASAHDSGLPHSSGHDSGHQSGGHDSGHHSSSHDSGGHHSSSHDTGGGTCDSGGDVGGGCDSGGGVD